MTSFSDRNETRAHSLVTAAVFVAAVVGVGLAIGYATRPGEWYDSLAKPAFNPPSWVFGPVWTMLYVLIAIAGWRIWRVAPKSAAMVLWAAQMGLNWLWSPVFFAAQAPGLAVVIIVALLAAIVGFILQSWKHDRLAAGLFVPYAAWVTFAAALNGSIAAMN